MNNFQRFKLVDAVGQVLVTPTAYFLLQSADPSSAYDTTPTLVGCYLFGVGAWQATSCLLWAVAMHGKHVGVGRKIYSWTLLVLTLATLFGGLPRGMDAMNMLGILLLYVLLFVGPVMSIWYFLLTIAEVSSLREKAS